MCSMKCTGAGADAGAGAGAGTGAGAVCSVSVQCHRKRFSTSNQVSLITFMFLILGFKRIASNRLSKIH